MEQNDELVSGVPRGERVAYLVSQYPTVSHAFIEREISALRGLGAEVHTFSVRPSRREDLLSRTAEEEAGRTVNLLGRRRLDYAKSFVKLFSRHPAAVAQQVGAALRTGPRTARSRLWQLFYLAEAVVLREELIGRDLRHVHVHFANNGADIGRRVVALGLAADGPESGWNWTLSMHGPTEFADPIGFDLTAKATSCSGVAAISEFCRDELLRDVPESWQPATSIVRMSVDSTRFPGAADLRLAREPGPLRLLFVGRLVQEKGPDVLLRAVRLVVDRGIDLRVTVIGRGPLQQSLEDLRRSLGLEGVVELPGAVGQDDLPQWYEWADVFCLPSYEEGVPVVLMEAMATELPVVTTRIAGIPELVHEGSGTLVAPGDPDAVASAVAAYAADPQLRAAVGRRARRRVIEDFDPQQNGTALLELFDQVRDPAAVLGGAR